MSDFATVTGRWVAGCVSCGATRKGELLVRDKAWRHRDAFESAAYLAGWRLFIPTRGARRWYCSGCGPSTRHNMHELKPRQRNIDGESTGCEAAL